MSSGGSSGGMVVGGPDGNAALLAGQYQSQAAQYAAQQAQQMVNQAILAINQNYQQARYDVQPYRTEGVQALNQLNQYLGLDPYNPGAAPTAPKLPTLDDYMNQVTQSDLNQYIRNNTGLSFSSNSAGQTFARGQYIGGGLDPDQLFTLDASAQGAGHPTPGYYSRTTTGAVGGLEPYAAESQFISDPVVQAAARKAIAQERVNSAMPLYEQNLTDYNRNLDEYNQNLTMYNQYKAEGPLTQAQITDRITNQPGYQAELSQGIDAIQKAAGARGYLGSGRVLKELGQFGQNTLGTYYNNTLSRLAGLAGAGQQAATTSAGINMNQGSQIAQAYTGLGDTLANSSLASGNALAQAILAANQQYRVVGGSGGGGGLGGIGSVLGGVGSILGSGLFG